MSGMSKQGFSALHKLRERREDHARKDLQVKRTLQQERMKQAEDAQAVMDRDIAARKDFAARWNKRETAPRTAADQIAGRACLARKDAEAMRSMEAAMKATEVLLAATDMMQESARLLKVATARKEKSRHSAERHAEIVSLQRLQNEEADLDEETEVQVMSRFAKLSEGERADER